MKMRIELHEITVRDLVEGYRDNQEGGVTGYGGRLDIRPPFQREFVYKDKQRAAVVETIRKEFPLNVLYWAVREDKDDEDEPDFEIIDGQQRTISICQYVEGEFSVDDLYFHNLADDQQQQILAITAPSATRARSSSPPAHPPDATPSWRSCSRWRTVATTTPTTMVRPSRSCRSG